MYRPYDGSTESEIINAMKLSFGMVHYRGLSIEETFYRSIKELYRMFEVTTTNKYLETAVLQIRAYLEMGFIYDKYSELFDNVLKSLGTSRDVSFPKRFYCSSQIRLNKSQVKKMIRKWSTSRNHTMKIDEVVDDIITKVKNNEKGIYHYHSNKEPIDMKDTVSNDIYELVIDENGSFFCDIKRQKYYTFKI